MAGRRGKKNVRNGVFRATVVFLVIPLAVLNTYAYWQLSEAAGHWSMAWFAGSIAAQMTQLAIILAFNNLVIILLLMQARGKR